MPVFAAPIPPWQPPRTTRPQENPVTHAYWTNAYDWTGPRMYQPNYENNWSVFGRPVANPWGAPGSNPLLELGGQGILLDNPKAANEAFLAAYGLDQTDNALTRFTRSNADWLDNQYTLRAAQPGTDPSYTYLDFLQNDATGLLDEKYRNSTSQQLGLNPAQYAGRVRSVGGLMGL